MSLVVVKAGVADTVQDAGRFGHAASGVNRNGFIDWYAAAKANALVGNNANLPTVELFFPASTFRVRNTCCVAIAGADFLCCVNGIAVRHERCFIVNENDTISFQKKLHGEVSFLAVYGGFSIPKVLGSAATNLLSKFGGISGRTIQKDDVLPVETTLQPTSIGYGNWRFRSAASDNIIRVCKGPEWHVLSDESKQYLLSANWEKSVAANRMAIAIEGEQPLQAATEGILSSPVLMGTIQLLPSGKMLVLAADHQTTGGYPRILQVAKGSMPALVQMHPREKFSFEIITIDEALILERAMQLPVINMKMIASTNLMYG